ncbi:Aste57867_8216 [Aphanomyces stellatus]|uniref:Aste57867_8216 protein n=1 Tax=Aphanomyces stellatus TaxID=120398 RepID=A0A485KJN4_9STRA|nr:hypothetical protein As57867_008185 [Aphanomyces stellatus]VFT85103.1 Aste57867_8216 [Aphanomyces stellatus]
MPIVDVPPLLPPLSGDTISTPTTTTTDENQAEVMVQDMLDAELAQRAGSLCTAMTASTIDGGDDDDVFLDVDESSAALAALLSLEDNQHCADCHAATPKWATITHGGFICTQCAGVHRSLGVHVSFVQSCTLDKWTPAQLLALDRGGNTKLNETLEFSVPPSMLKPNAESPRDERAAFIHAKYVDQAFRMGPNKRRQEAIMSTHQPMAPRPETSVSSHGSCGMVEYVGILTIELVEGAKLAAMDVNGSSDPYVSFRLGEQVISSHAVKHSLNPVWNETLRLSWDGVSPLVVQVYSYNKLQPDRKMGMAVIDADRLQHLDADKPLNMWFLTTMPREWARNFGDHMVAAGEGLTKGVVTGLTGIVMDPIRGAKRNGWGGFAKGVGLGMAGAVVRPIQGLGAMVKQTAMGVLGKKARQRVWKRSEAEVDAGSIHVKLTLQTF